jgi:hypothetical protein
MNTRAIITFLEDGVEIIEEYILEREGLIRAHARYYRYRYMTHASFQRLVNLHNCTQAITHLVGWARRYHIDTLIYWKREHRRVYHE